MKFRSWLVVPGNSEKRLANSIGLGADQIVIDLDSTVPVQSKQAARAMACEWLNVHRHTVPGQRLRGRWVRINSFDTGYVHEDLVAIMAGAPDGIILPRASGPEAVRQLAADIYELEQRHGLVANTTRIIPVVGETPRAAMMLGTYLESAHQRLAGLTWNSASLAAEIGATSTNDEHGCLGETFRFVRAQALLTARAGEVMAIDAACNDFEDEEAVSRMARAARNDGFTGMFAVHPDQVSAINKAFQPVAAEIDLAKEIVALFDGSPQVNSIAHGGRMLDRAHLLQAQRLLGQADSTRGDEVRRGPILRSA